MMHSLQRYSFNSCLLQSLLQSIHAPFLLFVMLTMALVQPYVAQADLAQTETVAQLRFSGLIVLCEKVVKKGTPPLYQIKIKGDNAALSRANLNAEIFAIEDPPRLVIDLPEFKVESATEKSVSDAVVSAIRLGVHPEKTRVVIDLAGDGVVNHRSNVSGSTLLIEFYLSKTPTPFPKETPAIPKATPPKVKSEAEEIIKFEEEEEEEEETKKQEPIKAQTSSVIENSIVQVEPADSSGLVSSISFKLLEDEGNSPGIMIEVSNLGNYSLSKKEANLYELTVENTKFAAEHLALPNFPPDNFRGIEAVIAREEGKNVVIKVYVEEKARLNPFRTKGQLWLKVIP